jgi:type IV secretion system protein VirB11
MSTRALENSLQPLQPFLQQDGVTEICINQPGEVFVEQNQQFTRYEIPELTFSHLHTLVVLVGEYNHKLVNSEQPLLAGSLPNGARIQCVLPPACEKGKIICSIRRHQLHDKTLDDYQQQGLFDEVKAAGKQAVGETDKTLLSLYEAGDFYTFLCQAILAKKNILISGGTGTGKTTFLNACIKCIPAHERLITLEDTREVKVTQTNAVHLLAESEAQAHMSINLMDLFKACLRLRPDRILLAEIRGQEALAFLRAANSGHPGSFSTIHADTPQACFEQLTFMLQQAGMHASPDLLLAYIQKVVDIIVQLKRNSSGERFMQISDIFFNKVSEAK